jgi:hypothetical protein
MFYTPHQQAGRDGEGGCFDEGGLRSCLHDKNMIKANSFFVFFFENYGISK